jgi:hypothetical protein
MVTLTSMFGRPAVHVTEATLSPPPTLSLVNVTVASGTVNRPPP